MEELTRRELLVRGGRVALVTGGFSLARPLVELARAGAGGIFDELAAGLRGEVVLPGASAYEQARLLYNMRRQLRRLPMSAPDVEELVDNTLVTYAT